MHLLCGQLLSGDFAMPHWPSLALVWLAQLSLPQKRHFTIQWDWTLNIANGISLPAIDQKNTLSIQINSNGVHTQHIVKYGYDMQFLHVCIYRIRLLFRHLFVYIYV